MGQVTLRFTHMVEDRDAAHEGTQVEDKPPAAEREEASEAAAKGSVQAPEVELHLPGSLGREGPQVTRRLGGVRPHHPGRLGRVGPCQSNRLYLPCTPQLPGFTEFLGQARPILVPTSPEPALSLSQCETALGSQEDHLGLRRGNEGEGYTGLVLVSCPCPQVHGSHLDSLLARSSRSLPQSHIHYTERKEEGKVGRLPEHGPCLSSV